MQRKDELLADSRLKKLGILPKIYHFDVVIEPFRGITIADAQRSWNDVRMSIEDILSTSLLAIRHERSTMMLKELHERGIYGVAICELRDQHNRQRGRTIAKGRLWKHLKLRYHLAKKDKGAIAK
ncbi:hypothetical protein [ANMV-1 virus]|nr:hypothetical protein [ANMV-1 virus]